MYCPKYIMYYTFMKVEQLCKAPLTKSLQMGKHDYAIHYYMIRYILKTFGGIFWKGDQLNMGHFSPVLDTLLLVQEKM